MPRTGTASTNRRRIIEAVAPFESCWFRCSPSTKTGCGLGYGGGYYDRTLAQLREAGHIVAIGVAYAGQEVASLPHHPHDQRLDMVVTEHGFRKFG